MSKIPVIICGGHFSPALALIESLSGISNIDLYYLGSKYSLSREKTASFEYRQISKLDLTYLPLTSSKFNRFFSFELFLSLFKLPLVFIQSLNYLTRLKPKLIVSFGSYISLPICILAYFFRIPVIAHEQTRVMGLSNRVISFFAKTVCLTFDDTKKVPQRTKTVTVGILLRNSILKPTQTGITRFGKKNFPLIYITGGSQGSVSINSVIYKLITRLVNNFRVIHVCGQSLNNFDYHRFSKLRLSFNQRNRENYYLAPFLDYNLVGEVLKNSDLVISRAGANSIAEIAFYGKKSILIPLPWAAENEQYENAIFLKNLGLAKIIDQRNLNSDTLYDSILEILNIAQISSYKFNIIRNKLDGREKFARIVKSQIGIQLE